MTTGFQGQRGAPAVTPFAFGQPRKLPNKQNLRKIKKAFDREALARICEMSEWDFDAEFDLQRFSVVQAPPNDFYYYKDNGSNILAVAHLDTVARASSRTCRFIDTASGPVVYSRALDDRLGAYIILDMLPKMGITFDILLTTGEEQGRSTAAFFETEKDYNWIIEFDRGGSDVVMYQFEDEETKALVQASGARVGDGIFSDISELDFLGCKAFNWGTGYQEYHTARSHAYLDDTFNMVSWFLNFHEANKDDYLEHIEPTGPEKYKNWWDEVDEVTPVDFYRDDPDEVIDVTTLSTDWATLPTTDLFKLADLLPATAAEYDMVWDELERRDESDPDFSANFLSAIGGGMGGGIS